MCLCAHVVCVSTKSKCPEQCPEEEEGVEGEVLHVDHYVHDREVSTHVDYTTVDWHTSHVDTTTPKQAVVVTTGTLARFLTPEKKIVEPNYKYWTYDVR